MIDHTIDILGIISGLIIGLIIGIALMKGERAEALKMGLPK